MRFHSKNVEYMNVCILHAVFDKACSPPGGPKMHCETAREKGNGNIYIM